MHKIEFDLGAPNRLAPWKVTTSDGAEWHAPDERSAVTGLGVYIRHRQYKNGLTAEAPEVPSPARPA